MNQNSLRNLQFNLSGAGCWLFLFAVFLLLGSIGLGWLVKSFLVILALIIITPVIAFIGFRWWLQRNLVEGSCPVCQTDLTGINNVQFRCPSCGESLKTEKGEFVRQTPPGTIDVDVVEVQARQIEDSETP